MATSVKGTRTSGLFANRPDFSKFLTRAHITSTVSVIIGIVIAIVFAKGQIYVGSIVSLLVAGGVTYAINRPERAIETADKGADAKKSKTRDSTKIDARNPMNGVILNTIVVGVLISIVVSAVLPLLHSVVAMTLICTWVLFAYWKQGQAWKPVWESFTLVMLPAVKLNWLPIRFHLDGTWKHFILGWLPFCSTAGMFVPEVGIPFTKKWFRLTMIKIELVDIIFDIYLIWSLIDIRAAAAAHPQGLSLMFDALAIGQLLLVMSILVVLNKDGSKWRVIFYIVIAFAGLTSDLGNAKLFALEKGWLNPDFVAVDGVHGQVVEFMCIFGLLFEAFVQPVWNWFMGLVAEPIKLATKTMEMAIVSPSVPVSTSISEGGAQALRSHVSGKPNVREQAVVAPVVVGSPVQVSKPAGEVVNSTATAVKAVSVENADHAKWLSIIKSAVRAFSTANLADVQKAVAQLASTLKVEDQVKFLEKCSSLVKDEKLGSIAEFEDFIKAKM